MDGAVSSEQFLLNGFGNENIGSYEQADNLTKRFLMNHTAASMLNDEFAGIDKGYQAGVFNAEGVIAWKSLHAANSASKLIDAGFSGDDQVFLGAFFMDATRSPALSPLQLSQPTIPNMDMRSTLRQMSIGGSGTDAMANTLLYGLQHGGQISNQSESYDQYTRPATALEALDTVDSILTGVAVASGVGTGIAAGKIYLKNKIKNEIRDYYKEKLIQKAYKELSRADYKKFKSTISKSDDWSMTRNWDITQDVAKLDKIKKLGTTATYATLSSQFARAGLSEGDQQTDAYTTMGVAGTAELLGNRLNTFSSVKVPTSAAGFAVNAALGALAYFTSGYAEKRWVDSEGKPNSLLNITGHAKYWVRDQL